MEQRKARVILRVFAMLIQSRYPAFDGKVDVKPEFKDVIKRVDYGFSKGGPPVDNVRNDEITCRTTPLIAPAITAPIRAGANITFKWTDWFTNHKGPVLTVSDESGLS